MTFLDKTYIITGAGGGMGKSLVTKLLDEGANVVGCDLHLDKLKAVQANEKFIGFEGDLLDEAIVKKIFTQTIEEFNQIDGLVNIAGIAQKSTPIEEVSLAKFHQIMDINMTMTFILCKEATKHFKKARNGTIINIGSVSTTRPRPGLQSYVASKGAVESFSKSLALELAPYKVTVNTLHPGPCATEMLGQFAEEGANVKEMKETVFKQSVPLGELLQPDDIANSLMFLLSAEAKMVTGAVLHVDGGRSI